MYRNAVKMQGKPLVWLDNASTTFKPDCVIEEIVRYYSEETANSHRGDYDLCYNIDQKILASRKTVAHFINSEVEEVVFTTGTTGSINLVAFGYAAKTLKEGDEILLSEAEHASNLLPWFKVAELTGARLAYVPLDKEGRITVENVQKSLTPKTKIVALAQVGNVLGFVAPIKEIAAICHRNHSILVVDGAQSVPHMKVDVKDLDCDFLSFSGHKLLGPTGVGVLYGKMSLLLETDPYVSGGGNNDKFYKEGTVTFLKPPMKFEAGTLNIEGILGLKPAIEYIEKVGIENINAHERELKAYAVEKLKATKNCVIYNEDSEAGIVTFNIDGVFAQDAATFLNSRGIACRSGQHCAKILNDFLGTPATVRASFYLYTTKEDIDLLADAVAHGKEFLDAYFI
ncbi:MAG: cysteine desulfurase [Bacilli bacterium]|nr:cysteine desulfurase [Bacilli bacterium]